MRKSKFTVNDVEAKVQKLFPFFYDKKPGLKLENVLVWNDQTDQDNSDNLKNDLLIEQARSRWRTKKKSKSQKITPYGSCQS